MLSDAPYRAPVSQLPTRLRELDFDAFRSIRFRPDRAVWADDKLPFELEMFHPGRGYQYPVRINTIDRGIAKEIAFDPAAFDYGATQIDPKTLQKLGFAGFRVHYAINKKNLKEEVLVFLGASYFRAVAKGQVYGLSGRALAIDTGEPGGEEFPRFVEFWIERPSRNARSLTLYALLDSPRTTGAYRFVLTPGTETVMQVTARLYPREQIRKVGLAPLTSMYFFGENQPSSGDYRPEVHDSDGLSIADRDGAWIWRPLVNPKRLLITSFASTNPKGFGLMQRDRAVSSYEDPEPAYSKRPSTWVEPLGVWGAGRVELVQIPTTDETNDNIVAYWVPDVTPEPHKPFNLAYRLHWEGLSPPKAVGWVAQSRRGHGATKLAEGEMQYVVDFEGDALAGLKPDDKVGAVIRIGNGGQLAFQDVLFDNLTGAWRLTLRVKRADANQPLELSAFLKFDNDEPLTETWSYIVPADTDK